MWAREGNGFSTRKKIRRHKAERVALRSRYTSFLFLLVMNAAMKLGNTNADSAIMFENKGLIKQYIDPATMAVKFYACKDSKTTMEISDVLKAFGEGKVGVRGLLDNSSLKGLCVTYHEGKGTSRILILIIPHLLCEMSRYRAVFNLVFSGGNYILFIVCSLSYGRL